MRNLVTIAVVVLVVLVFVLGVGPAVTKLNAGREVAARQIHKVTPDDVILAEIQGELRLATERNAEAQVELQDLRHEYQRRVNQTGRLESKLDEHRQALAKARTLLESDRQEFILSGQRIARQRLAQDVLARIRVCKSLETDLSASQDESRAYEQSLQQFEGQITKATQEYQVKVTEYDRLRADLRTSRVIQALSTRLSTVSTLSENSNLARLTAEARKRIARSRASSELFTPAADSGLLDFSSASGPSAREAADAYLEGVSQRGVGQSRQEPPVPSNSLLEGID